MWPSASVCAADRVATACDGLAGFSERPNVRKMLSDQHLASNGKKATERGRLISEDPKGIEGGINLYEFAASDPINNSDPLGLEVQVGCRPLYNPLAGLHYAHCAVRVRIGNSGPWQAGELIPDDGRKPTNHIRAVANESEYNWVTVPVPAGQMSEAFDRAVMRSFNSLGDRYQGRLYNRDAGSNSNHFVYEVIFAAGGRIPHSAVPGDRKALGLCGGMSGTEEGNNCIW